MSRSNRFIFSILVVGILSTFITSCKKETMWTPDWVLPLVNDTLDIRKFVNDSTLEESSGFYALNLKRTIYDMKLSEFVAIPDTIIERSMSLSSSGLTVNPGFEFYNSIEEHELNLQDLELKLVQLSGGFLDFEIDNPIGTGVYITVELPGVQKNNQQLSETFFIEAGSNSTPSTISETIDLTGYTIDLRGQDGTLFNLLQSRVKIKTDPNGVTVTVNSSNVFNVRSKFRDISLYYARGYFGSRAIEDVANFNIDALNSVIGGSIDIQNTSVKMIIENGIKIDASGVIQSLKNTNNQGNSVNLSGSGIGNSFSIDQPTGSFSTLQPSYKEILFTSGNSNIEAFIENLGVKNEIAYKININPWGNSTGGWNEVFPQSRLNLKVEAQMPLSIQMDALTVRDTFDIDIQQNRDKSHIESGILSLDLDNGFPFSGRLKLLFLDDAGNVVETIDGSATVLSSLYGSPNQNGLMHNKSTVELPLNSQIIEKINTVKSVVVEAVFDTPDPLTSSNQMVGVPVDAYLGIKMKAKFKLKVKV